MLLANKEGISLIRNINKLLKSEEKKKPPVQNNTRGFQASRIFYMISFEQNIEMFRFDLSKLFRCHIPIIFTFRKNESDDYLY